jgi:hypothetical protein
MAVLTYPHPHFWTGTSKEAIIKVMDSFEDNQHLNP